MIKASVTYGVETVASLHAHAVHGAHSYVLRLSTPTTFVLPGEYLEMDILPDLGLDCTLVIEAYTNALSNKMLQS